MNPNDPNVALIEVVARHLDEALRRRLVFVGGAVAGLLITDPAVPAIRPTDDVDMVVHVAALHENITPSNARWLRGASSVTCARTPRCAAGASGRWPWM